MTYLVLLISVSFLLFVYMVYKAHHDTVKYKTICDDRLPSNFNDFRVFFISDVHRRKIRDSTLKSITNKLDIVIIGGDLTEKGVPLARTENNIKKLKKWKIPIYFVWGNNDYEALPEKIYMLLIKENVTILTNESKDIEKDNSTLSILGLDCCRYGEPRLDLAQEKAKGEYFILITHAPSAFVELERRDRDKIHTVLAGHTHGGQIRIFGFGPYERGTYKKLGNTNSIVSEGYGYSKLPFRLGTNAECNVVTFRKNEAISAPRR